MATQITPRRHPRAAGATPDPLDELRRRVDSDADVLLRLLIARRHEWLAEGEDLSGLELG
jgi:hypothetical protein